MSLAARQEEMVKELAKLSPAALRTLNEAVAAHVKEEKKKELEHAKNL